MADDSSYAAQWTEPGKTCGVSASEYGVHFWWSTGPRESDGWGESYTWERWFAEGRVQGGGPDDMLTRIEAVGRFLGHAPKREPARQHKRRDVATVQSGDWQRYLSSLQQQAAHTTPETLRVSRREFARLRKQALQRAELFWALLRPGIAVQPSAPMLVTEGTRSRRETRYLPANGMPGFTLVETEDRFESEGRVSIWFQLRVQCVLSAQRQFGIWFVDGKWQLEILVEDAATVTQVGDAIRRAHPEWGTDPRVCGAVRAFVQRASSSTMFNACFGSTGPTRLTEQHSDELWPLPPPEQAPAPPIGGGRPAFRPWSPEIKRILGFAFDADASLQRLAIDSGLHWIEPIGTTTSGCWLGVRRLPQLPREACPVLLCHGPNAVTVATQLRMALPILVWRLGPLSDPGQTETLRRSWAGIEDQLAACAGAVGGVEALQRIRQWLDADRDPDLDARDPPSRGLAAGARIMGQLDPGQQAFRQHVVALAETPDMLLQFDAVGAAWQHALLATAYSARPGDSDRAWGLAGALPSLDLAGRIGVGHVLNVKIAAALPALAASVALRQPRRGPLERVLQAICAAQTAGTAYDGHAHIEAAARASIDGDHHAAWQLLGAAGYWSACAQRKADPVIHEAARAVAKQVGYGALP